MSIAPTRPAPGSDWVAEIAATFAVKDEGRKPGIASGPGLRFHQPVYSLLGKDGRGRPSSIVR